MKLKQFLAGAMAAALLVTSVPAPWLGNVEARAAEDSTDYVDVPIKMGAAESQELTGECNANASMGGQCMLWMGIPILFGIQRGKT